jgi:hypothetical protein
MNATPTSRAAKATKKANGTLIVTTNHLPPAYKIPFKRNPPRIAKRVCPATMLAKSRTPKDRARTQNLTSSMINKRGNKTNGVPSGIKWAKKSNPRLLSLRKRTQNQTKNDSLSLTARDAVRVWVNGSLPTRFRIKTSIKIAMKKGAISSLLPFN